MPKGRWTGAVVEPWCGSPGRSQGPRSSADMSCADTVNSAGANHPTVTKVLRSWSREVPLQRRKMKRRWFGIRYYIWVAGGWLHYPMKGPIRGGL